MQFKNISLTFYWKGRNALQREIVNATDVCLLLRGRRRKCLSQSSDPTKRFIALCWWLQIHIENEKYKLPPKTDFCARDFQFKERSFPIMMENTNINTNDKSSFAKEADQICSNNDSSASNYTRRNTPKKTGGVQIKQIISQRISCETCSSHPTIYLYIFDEWKKLWVFTRLKMSPRPIIPW